jgi:urocanate hydratase
MAEHASDETGLLRWTHFAREQVRFQGLPSRVCRPGYPGDGPVADGETSAPAVVTRDHLDAGWSVPNPSVNWTARADAGYEAAIEETRQSDVPVSMDK